MDSRPVTFTLAELWLLNDLVRHEVTEGERWRWPPASKELCDEIAMALVACEDHGLEDYTLMLSEGDCMVIDYNVMRDHKTPEGANGREMLLKTFRARSELAFGFPDDSEKVDDKVYTEEVSHRAGN